MNEFWDGRSVISCVIYTKVDWFSGANKAGSGAECARAGSWPHTHAISRLSVIHVSEPNANTGPHIRPGGAENHAVFGKKVTRLASRTSAYRLYDGKFAGGMQKSPCWDGSVVQPCTLAGVPEDFRLDAESPCSGLSTDAQQPTMSDIFGGVRDRGSLGAAR